MPITTADALSLAAGDAVTDGTTEFTVTGVDDKGSGKFVVYLVLPGDDVENVSFFTQDHLRLISKVEPAPVAPDEPTEAPTIPEPSAVEDLPAFENGVGWVDDPGDAGDDPIKPKLSETNPPKGKGKGK